MHFPMEILWPRRPRSSALPLRVVCYLALLLLSIPSQADALRLSFNRKDIGTGLGHSERAPGSPSGQEDEVDHYKDQLALNAQEQPGQSLLREEAQSTISGNPFEGVSMVQALAMNSGTPGEEGSENKQLMGVLGAAKAFSNHMHDLAKDAVACEESAQKEEPSELTALLTQSRQCRHSHNPILVIDGGSTGTRGALFRVTSKSCPRVGRKVLPESIVFLEEGTKYAGLRQTMEKWLDENAGNDWASHPYDAKALLTKYPSMLKAGRELMHNILDNVAEMIKNHFNLYDQEDSKAVGVPVLFFSTAGVRDTHDWYRRGLFAAFMIAINSYTGPHGFNFFTNEEWTRPIPGMEEGMLAFTAANFLLGNFQKMQSLKQRIEDADTPEREKKELEKEMRSSLISIVEMGGASAQVVFPVFNVGSSPSFVNTLNLVGANYLSSDYPSVDILSASYMQLGASSATGIFYKAFCSSPENLIGGVCHNPCLPENFKQDCSTGEVKIEPDGRVNVATSIQKQRVKPAAYYCTSSNDEISKKALNRLSCLAAGINPDEPLEKRLAIENCEEMKGTGNFEACKNAVSAILLDPQLPLPANQEASYTGFDTIGQIFDFLSTSTNVVITGMALVAPIRELQKLGLLSDDYSGDVCALKEAAMRYCAAPVVLSEKNQLVRRVEVKGKTKDVPLTNYNLENCLKLGLSHGLLTLLHKSKIHPSNIQFAIDIVDPKTGKKVAEYGWPPGAILRAILDVETWARDAYILGVNHTVRDRWNATHPKGEHAVEE